MSKFCQDRHQYRFASHISLLLAALCLATSALGAQDDTVARTVRGEVVDQDGVGLSGAIVRLFPQRSMLEDIEYFQALAEGRAEAAAIEARSDQNGHFSIALPDFGPWRLELSAPGTARVLHLLPWSTGDLELPPIRLSVAERVAFSVEDSSGKPVVGARVLVDMAAAADDLTLSDQVAQSATTNAKGFAGFQLAAGFGWISVVAEGFVPVEGQRVDLLTTRTEAARLATTTVVLKRGVEHGVRVLVDGEPATQAALLLYGGSLPSAITDPDGSATLTMPTATDVGTEPWVTVIAPGGDLLHSHVPIVPARSGTSEGATTTEPVQTISLVSQLVKGRVVDPEGRPIALAKVWVADPRSTTVQTDEGGRFELTVNTDLLQRGSDGAPLGRPKRWSTGDAVHHALKIHVAAPGWLAAELPIERAARIVLERSAGLHITVTDETEAPLLGVLVAAEKQEFDFTSIKRSSRLVASTAANGVARLSPLDPDSAYSVEVYLPGFRRFQTELAPTGKGASDRELSVVLEYGSVQVGWVEDPDGRAIAGAVIEVPRSAKDELQRFLQHLLKLEPLVTTLSDAEGRFELHDLSPGRIELKVSASGYGPMSVAGVEVLAHDAEIGTLTMVEGLELTGAVLDENGEAIEGARVNLDGPERKGSRYMSMANPRVAQADEEGAFRFVDLEAGSYFVSVEERGFRGFWEKVELAASRAVEIELFRGMGLPVGVVDVDDDPVGRVVVNYRARDVNDKTKSGQGRFEQGYGTLYGLAAGDLSFSVTRNGSARLLQDVPVTLSEDGTPSSTFPEVSWDGFELTLRIAGGNLKLTGTVVDADGVPVAVGSINSGSLNSATIIDGRYEIDDLSVGPFMLNASAEGEPPYRERITLEGEGTTIHNIQFERGWQLAGTIRDSAGRPVSGAQVRGSTINNRWFSAGRPSAISDVDGGFVIDNLASGSYILGALKEGYSASVPLDPVMVDADVAGVDLEMKAGARVFGRVLGTGSERFDTLRISTDDGSSVSLSFDGGYELKDLSAGPARLSLSGPDLDGVRRRAIIVPVGGELEYDFVVADHRLSGIVMRGEAPQSGVTVSLEGPQNVSLGGTITDDEGRFSINHLDDGTGTLRLALNGSTLHEQSVDVFADQDLLISLEVFDLRGRVTAPDGSPVNKARVQLTSDAPTWTGIQTMFAMTDAEGLFSLPLRQGKAPPEGYLVSANARGFGGAVKLWSGESAAFLELSLSDTAPIEIHWLGRRPKSGRVALADRSGRVVLDSYLSNDRWTIEHAPIGEWTLFVVAGLVQVSTPVEVSGDTGLPTTIDLDWPPSGRVRVVVPETEDPVRDPVQMRVIDGSGRLLAYPRGGALRPEVRSSMVQRGFDLAVGHWLLEFERSGVVVARKRVTVFDDGSSRVVSE